MPDDAAGMAVGQPREEIRPGQRPGIGVHDIDLELRDDHERRRQRQRQRVVGHHVAEGRDIHVGGIGGLFGRDARTQCQHDEKRSGQQFRRAHHHPAGAGEKPHELLGQRLRLAVGRQEAQEIHLFADLRHQRQDDGGGRPEHRQIERRDGAEFARLVALAGEAQPEIEFFPVGKGDEDKRQDVEHDPDGLGQQLEFRDQPHAMRHQRNDGHRADDVAQPQRDAEGQLQRPGHDRGLDGKQDEGEAGIDQRRHRRAKIAEPRSAGQKIDIDAVLDGIAGNRDADDQQQQRGDEDGEDGIGGAVGQGDRPAHRLQRQEGDGTDRRLRNPRR